MLDNVLREFTSLADEWEREVMDRRERTTVDPVADDAAFRATKLRERIKKVAEATEMLSPATYAALHNTTAQTVTAWCRKGVIECEPNGRSYLIPRTARAPRSRATLGQKRAARRATVRG